MYKTNSLAGGGLVQWLTQWSQRSTKWLITRPCYYLNGWLLLSAQQVNLY